jgi:alpha-L-rhamnosidase
MFRMSLPIVLGVAALALLPLSSAVAQITPVGLRCEYRTNPLAVDLVHPRLSWRFEAKGSHYGQYQTAYRLLVARSAASLAQNRGDLWDTGIVKSDETIQIAYNGSSLASSETAYWKVCVWDKDGKQRWSAPAMWTKGIEKTDWEADWIQAPPPVQTTQMPTVSLDNAEWIWAARDPDTPPVGKRVFRYQFSVPVDAKVYLAVAADNSYAVSANGKTVPGAMGSGWKDYKTYNITSDVKMGANYVDIAVENEGEAPNPAGFLANIVVIDALGRREYPTGINWVANFGPNQNERVRVLGKNGIGPWGKSDPAGKSNNTMTPPPHFKKEFVAQKPVKRALLYATALGVYELALNNKTVSNDVFSPGWTDYAKRVHYLAYDVTKQVKTGQNTLNAQLGDGWYAGYLAFTGRRRYYGGDPKLRLQLQLEYADGTKETVGTDSSWQWAYGGITSADMLMGTTIDTRKSPTDWQPVLVAADPNIIVTAHPGEPIRPADTVVAKTRTEPKKGVYVYNLGQNITGWAKIVVNGKAGQTITVRHAERLNPDGSAYFTNLRAAKAIDTYILKGGKQVLEPKFTFHGFQYVEISGADAPPAIKEVAGIMVHSTMARTLAFDSSNPLLNKLNDNIDWGFRGNALDVPTDCPQRDERAGWTGDAQVFAKTAMLHRDDAAFFTKWLVDLVQDGQGADGALPDVAPYISVVGRGNAAWEDSGVVITYRMYEMFGDTQAIRDHWTALTRYMEHLEKVAPDGIRQPGSYGDWLLLDAPQRSAVHGTAYYFYCAKLMAQMADATGKSEEATRYRALAEKIKVAFNAKFVTADGQVVDNSKSSQTFYALALGWDLLPAEKRKLAQVHLEKLLSSRNDHLATGFIGTPVLLFALDSVGRSDLSNKLVLNEDFPSWLYQVKLGSTTMWERWDGWTPEKGFQDAGMNSFNHYWLGCVSEWMTTGLIGLDTDGPGWKKITVRPRIEGSLTRASTSYDSIRGKISAGWQKNSNNTVTITTTLPPNVTGTLVFGNHTQPLVSGTQVVTVTL